MSTSFNPFLVPKNAKIGVVAKGFLNVLYW